MLYSPKWHLTKLFFKLTGYGAAAPVEFVEMQSGAFLCNKAKAKARNSDYFPMQKRWKMVSRRSCVECSAQGDGSQLPLFRIQERRGFGEM